MSVTSELRRRVRAEQSLPRFEPCLPRPAKQLPAGPGWIHEIKHDGFRIIAYRSGDRVQLMTRAENNFASRFPLIVDAVAALPVRSCVIDGEAIACDENGLSVFELLRYQRRDQVVTLCAFDLMELDGEDLRWMPIEHRKSKLLRLIRDRHPGIVFNAHYIVDGAIVFKNACALGCEGIVSKRLGSTYRAGRSPHWLKVKNPKAPAVKREAEEDWSA
jgi:bifunctional non-homologous end joining protein LigD